MNNNYTGVFLLPTESNLLLLDISRIVRINAVSNYCRLYFSDSRFPITVAKTLGWFQHRQELLSFIRIHRGHLVNPQYIKCYRSKYGLLMLQNDELIPVARRRKPGLKERLIAFNKNNLSLPVSLLTNKTFAA